MAIKGTHILYYPKVMKYYLIAAKILFQLKWYLSHHYKKEIQDTLLAEDNYDYFSKYYNRTKQYMLANFFFGEWLSSLRGTKLSPLERQRFVWLSSCAPIFDDFFEHETDLAHVLQLLETPLPELADNKAEQTAVFFFNLILNSLDDKKAILTTAKQLFKAQTASKLQKQAEGKSIQDLLQISIEKGGFSGEMYGQLLDNTEHKEELLHLSYLLGAYGQLMDDVYDLYDDAKEGIKSFANQSVKIESIKEHIGTHRQEILTYVYTHFAHTKGYTRFINVMHIFDAMIALPLQHYQKQISKNNSSPKTCLQQKRAKWIIDMEKPINMIRLFDISAQMMQDNRHSF